MRESQRQSLFSRVTSNLEQQSINHSLHLYTVQSKMKQRQVRAEKNQSMQKKEFVENLKSKNEERHNKVHEAFKSIQNDGTRESLKNFKEN